MSVNPATTGEPDETAAPTGAPDADESMISLRDVHKVYRLRDGSQVHALDGLSLNIPAGSIHGIVGTSGAGKSTLVRCLTALERPTYGEVRVAGQDLTTLSANELRKARRAIGMVFQHANLLDQRTAAQNIAYPLDLAGAQKGQRHERVSRMLELVGLADRGSSYPAQLSGGQQQRVAIARALITNPDLLLCDEPTSALDPITTTQILDLLVEINTKLGVTILIITHQMNVIAAIADHVAVLEHGHLIEHGPVEQVFAHPREALTRQFVGTVVPQRLPDTLVREVSAGAWDTVLRVVHTDTAGRGVISHLEKEFGIQVELLHAVDASLRHTSVGIIILGLRGPSVVIDQALQWLHSRKHLEVEILP